MEEASEAADHQHLRPTRSSRAALLRQRLEHAAWARAPKFGAARALAGRKLVALGGGEPVIGLLPRAEADGMSSRAIVCRCSSIRGAASPARQSARALSGATRWAATGVTWVLRAITRQASARLLKRIDPASRARRWRWSARATAAPPHAGRPRRGRGARVLAPDGEQRLFESVRPARSTASFTASGHGQPDASAAARTSHLRERRVPTAHGPVTWVTMPPSIGAAMRHHFRPTPVPLPHMIGNSPARITATVIALGEREAPRLRGWRPARSAVLVATLRDANIPGVLQVQQHDHAELGRHAASAMKPTARRHRQVVVQQPQQPDAADQREGQGRHDQQRLVERLRKVRYSSTKMIASANGTTSFMRAVARSRNSNWPDHETEVAGGRRPSRPPRRCHVLHGRAQVAAADVDVDPARQPRVLAAQHRRPVGDATVASHVASAAALALLRQDGQFAQLFQRIAHLARIAQVDREARSASTVSPTFSPPTAVAMTRLHVGDVQAVARRGIAIDRRRRCSARR